MNKVVIAYVVLIMVSILGFAASLSILLGNVHKDSEKRVKNRRKSIVGSVIILIIGIATGLLSLKISFGVVRPSMVADLISSNQNDVIDSIERFVNAVLIEYIIQIVSAIILCRVLFHEKVEINIITSIATIMEAVIITGVFLFVRTTASASTIAGNSANSNNEALAAYALVNNETISPTGADIDASKELVTIIEPINFEDYVVAVEENPLFEEEYDYIHFSNPSGFYDEEFDLSIELQEGMRLFYTTDGSNPTRNSTEYTKPIHIYNRTGETPVYRNIQNVVPNYIDHEEICKQCDMAFILRMLVVDANNADVEMLNKVYFVGMEDYKDNRVISLVVDTDDMWGEDGIYVTGKEFDSYIQKGESVPEGVIPNFQKKGIDNEIAGCVDYFEYGREVGKQPCGVRIQGASTRNYRLKRLNLYSRDEYSGSGKFAIPFYPGIKTHSVTLRFMGGGDDLNALAHMLVEDRACAAQKYKKVSVFINGEFWYDTYMAQNTDDRFYSEISDVPKDCIGVGIDWDMMNGWIKWDSVSDIVDIENNYDIQSFIDTYITNIYFNNMDFSSTYNGKWWISKESIDSEDYTIHWGIYDMDCYTWLDPKEYGEDSMVAMNTFSTPTKTMFRYNNCGLYVNLCKYESFRKQFVLSFMDMINNNFSENNIRYVIANMGMSENTIYDENRFFFDRPAYMTEYLAEEFNLTGTLEEVTLSVNDDTMGRIKINTTKPMFFGREWTGKYFTDYPITLKAKAYDDYEFVRWEGDVNSTDKKIEVKIPEGGLNIKAIFRKK